MKKLLISLVCVGVLLGCASNVDVPQDKPIKIEVNQEESELLAINKKLTPEHKVELKQYGKKLERHNERVLAWAKRFTIVGGGIAVLGILMILPTIFGWFGKTIPVLTGAVGIVNAGLTWLATKANKKAGKVVGSSLARWGMWFIVAAGVLFAGAYYMDFAFKFIKWTMMTIGFLFGMAMSWEAACLYYTNKFDIPGDGIKPKA